MTTMVAAAVVPALAVAEVSKPDWREQNAYTWGVLSLRERAPDAHGLYYGSRGIGILRLFSIGGSLKGIVTGTRFYLVLLTLQLKP
jgi:hypothetical protein